jgi:NAD(P)-dependent dehydrogenase (short-subunit alcohol dehydrogenase family)
VGAFNAGDTCSKAAVVRLTEGVAEENRAHGISIFALSPGRVRTRLVDAIIEGNAGRGWRPELETPAFAATFTPTADAAAAAVVFLATGAADALTGRYFSAVCDDIVALARRADEVVRHDLYQIRKRTEPVE